MARFFTILCSCFLMLGCQSRTLSLHTDYITEQSLASYYVQTPDPLLNCPPFGQRLILSWSVPREYRSCRDLHILLTVRFHNKEEKELEIPLSRTSGTYQYCLLNEEFLEKRGVATYKAALFADGCLVEEWLHRLWKEKILFDEN